MNAQVFNEELLSGWMLEAKIVQKRQGLIDVVLEIAHRLNEVTRQNLFFKDALLRYGAHQHQVSQGPVSPGAN